MPTEVGRHVAEMLGLFRSHRNCRRVFDMCGVAGVIVREDTIDVQAVLNRMVNSIQHRGPDERGSVISNSSGWKIGLGHTRLGILDLTEAGSQPMAGFNGKCIITYNGEVYNFPALRRELQSAGYEFRSRTDTEVVVDAYEAWGLAAIERFRGMFGFGLLDRASRALILARDSFGIKPLYYFLNEKENVFLFASEIRALLASGLVPRRLSLEGLTSFLGYGSAQAPATIIEGVYSPLPGHYLVVSPRGRRLEVEEVDYANESIFVDSMDPASGNWHESVSDLRKILEESIRLHLQSEVPLGVFLSGGIDSSALVALMDQVTGEKPKTYSVVFGEQDFTEASYARTVSEAFGTEHHEIPLTEEGLLSMIPEAIGAMDQPSVDGINTFVISKAVKEAGITVALSGLGGDELFAGYPSFRRVKRMQRLARLPYWMRRAASAVGGQVVSASVRQKKIRQFMRCDGNPREVYAISRQLFSPDEIRRLLGRTPPQILVPSFDESRDLVNAISVCEIKGYMANTLLRDTDCMSMAHSLEVRVPFVDCEVVPFVLRAPGEWKLNGRKPKPLLLDALGALLPEEVWRRPKMGFTLPFERWLCSALRPDVDQLLAKDSPALRDAGLEPEKAHQIWRSFQGRPKKVGWSRPWALFVLGCWCEKNGTTI